MAINLPPVFNKQECWSLEGSLLNAPLCSILYKVTPQWEWNMWDSRHKSWQGSTLWPNLVTEASCSCCFVSVVQIQSFRISWSHGFGFPLKWLGWIQTKCSTHARHFCQWNRASSFPTSCCSPLISPNAATWQTGDPQEQHERDERQIRHLQHKEGTFGNYSTSSISGKFSLDPVLYFCTSWDRSMQSMLS